ncbi:MAG TPA: PEGA domain-containing protein [Oligoflexus sp.]|uniref:PEGA domain-containing protein n=1 Tax=Oligoflexus sp. TaxID=1971216 RepID=UPI002D29AF09|nr:PEGA domain-containing protein [Oligoflexus sp.]HYX35010.1 PEGA domain-containing protein [Oligoflexus sp.]
MKFKAISLIALALLSTHCATIVSGKTQTMTIDSNVKDADIVVDGVNVGKTPYTGPVTRAKSASVTLRKDGYASKTVTLNTEIEPMFWGNIIFGGVFGSTTDNSTGAMYKYAPGTLVMDLEKQGK